MPSKKIHHVVCISKEEKKRKTPTLDDHKIRENASSLLFHLQVISDNRINQCHFVIVGYHGINVAIAACMRGNVILHQIIRIQALLGGKVGRRIIGLRSKRDIRRIITSHVRLVVVLAVMVKSKTIHAEWVASSAGFIGKQGTLQEHVLDAVFGAAMLGSHVKPKIVIAMEAIGARGVEAFDLSS